jgi:ribosome biogenesis GTPase
MKPEDKDFSALFESDRKKAESAGCMIARVVAEHKEAYSVKTANAEYLAKITGKRVFNATSREDYPAVGDWVAITVVDKKRAVIQGILPRKTILRKKYSDKEKTQVIAANIDVAFIVESVDRDYNLNRLERHVVLANEGKIRPAVLLNKIDLISQEELEVKINQIQERFPTIDVIPTSIITEEGLDALTGYIESGKTYCFLGSSGVGKSSLINRLLGGHTIKVSEISKYTGRGKHTTTGRQVYFLDNGGLVVDNPGMREVGMTDSQAGIEDVFGEIAALSQDCKFNDCTHTHEHGCAVLEAIKGGELDENKYLNYLKLKKEAEHYKMTDLEKRKKDRQFGKFIKKAQSHQKRKGSSD